MSFLGIICIIIGLPLLIGYAISEKKNKMWLRLGLITLGLGVLLILIG